LVVSRLYPVTVVHDRPEIFSKGRVGEHKESSRPNVAHVFAGPASDHPGLLSGVACSFDAMVAAYAMQNRQKP
jgi:hypothetical protein